MSEQVPVTSASAAAVAAAATATGGGAIAPAAAPDLINSAPAAGVNNVLAAGLPLVFRSDSGASTHTPFSANPSANGNALAALPLTFKSILSYGNTEKSSGSLFEDANPFVGGVHRQAIGADVSNSGSSFRRSFVWNAVPYPFASTVADAAGSLYRSNCVDELWNLADSPMGAGACSEVRLGKRKQGAQQAAIKIVCKGAPDLFSSSGECREVVAFNIAGKHPNVVTCHEIYEDDRFIYLVLELLDGGQLLHRVAEKQFYPHYCENDVVNLIRGITRGLAHLHELGIAHRDIKPENVLYASKTLDPTIKLTDFGIAHTQCLTNEARDMVGTPLYVAPEVLLRRPYGCQADMWSLGVIVHILLTGYPPFDHDDLVQLVNMVKYEPLCLDGDEWVIVSDAARDFVCRLLTREVSKRLTAEKALAHAWLASPRPPPFPAPPTLLKVEGNGNADDDARSQDGTVPLLVAQANLHSFVMRREWKRIVHRKTSENNLKLSVLVSLSEKDLKISESFASREECDSSQCIASVRATHSATPTTREDKKTEPLAEVGMGAQTTSAGSAAEAGAPRKSASMSADSKGHGRKVNKTRGVSLDTGLQRVDSDDYGNGAATDRSEHGVTRQGSRWRRKRTTETSSGSSVRPSTATDGVVRADEESSSAKQASRRTRKLREKGKPEKKVATPGIRKDNKAATDHDREQERLRRQRLQLQAQLEKRRQSEGKSSSVDGHVTAGADDAMSSAGGTARSHGGRTDARSLRSAHSFRASARRPTDGTSIPTAGSVSSRNLSSPSSSSSSSSTSSAASESKLSLLNGTDDDDDGVDVDGRDSLLAISKLSDGSGAASDWLRERRDADAQDDVATIHKQRAIFEDVRKTRATVKGRRPRPSDARPQSERSKSRPPRVKRVGMLRMHRRYKSGDVLTP